MFKCTIPRAFIKNLNGDIPHWFVLEIAGTRKGWRVDTAQDGIGGFYFDYGWNEFVEDKSLQFGDFLLFEYEQPLILQVKIFEKDGTEKTAGTNLEPEFEIQGTECRILSPKTHGVVEADLWSTRPVHHEQNFLGPSLVLDDGYEKFQEDIDLIEKETADQCGIYEKQQDGIDGIAMVTDYGYKMNEKKHGLDDTDLSEIDVQHGVHEKRLENFDRTGKMFTTEQGVCYTITWRNVPHLYYYLTIPRSIVTGKALSNEVVLKDHEGTTWPMKLRTRPGGRVDLVQEWKEFLIENDVRNGDILTFQFVSDDVIHIHIERAVQFNLPFERAHKLKPMENKCDKVDEGYTITNRNVPSETKEKIETAFFDDFTNSSFSVTWRHTTRGSYLHIPKGVATKQKLENKETVVVCDPQGTKWPMKVRTRPSDGRVGLAQGWSTFWRHHNISNGDTLVFKFESDHLMKVNIIRALQVHPSLLNVRPISKQELMHLE
ncbi:putative B3 domain-containing protein At5g66980 [Silene latifolia]|uniref:putative B3 domain-containing protein At5g66980 n=1 Tax=Silene latifolia TaxID=37657 RepID=UPI003D77EA0A